MGRAGVDEEPWEGGGTVRNQRLLYRCTLPSSSIPVPLGFEHVEALGGSIQSIAAAKAGILKPGRPAVVSAQPHPEAMAEVLRCAALTGCDVLQAAELVRGVASQLLSSARPLMGCSASLGF